MALYIDLDSPPPEEDYVATGDKEGPKFFLGLALIFGRVSPREFYDLFAAWDLKDDYILPHRRMHSLDLTMKIVKIRQTSKNTAWLVESALAADAIMCYYTGPEQLELLECVA